ncbi:MAG: DMT family transporter [Syntrophomonadaceae bacterium]|nr:DMT family transporter [Syntrophomonadaceae bacterium]
MRLSLIYLALGFAILVMSTSSIMVRYCTAPALLIAFYRVLFTSFLAGTFRGGKLKDSIAHIQRRDFYFILGAGFFLALHFAFWISSLNYTSISSSVLFTNLQVIFVLIFSIVFLKEKPSLYVIGGILLALTGSLLIAHGDLRSGKLLGDMLALASGIFVAIYFVIGRKVRVRIDTLGYTSIVSAVAALVLFPVCLLGDISFSGYPLADWVLFLLMALLPGVVGHGVLNWALKYVKAPIVAVSILGESVGASILAYIIFGELLLWYQIIGGILILVGIYIAASNEVTGDGSSVT